jgi:hypothetical protein
MSWVSGLTLGILVIAFWKIVTLSAAVSRMERKTDALLKQAGIDPEPFYRWPR